jgi:hypothetical protein
MKSYTRVLISLWLYKENNKLRDRKNIFTYSPLSSTRLWLRCSNFFNPSKKNSFGCAANRNIGKAKDLSAPLRIAHSQTRRLKTATTSFVMAVHVCLSANKNLVTADRVLIKCGIRELYWTSWTLSYIASIPRKMADILGKIRAPTCAHL